MIKGLKRICASCATRFYDLGKSPIICPKCGAEFTGMVKIRTRRGRGIIDAEKAKAAELRDDQVDDTEEDEEAGATVSLNDLEEEENVGDEGDDENAQGGDLDLDDLDEDGDEDEEDLDDLDGDLEIDEEERS